MTRRRQFVNAVAVSLLTGPGAPRAQLPGRFCRLGIRRPTGKDGGLMAYATSPTAPRERIADDIDRIFDGAEPGELPSEQPSKFDLVINLKTAELLNLALPPSLLLRGEVIE